MKMDAAAKEVLKSQKTKIKENLLLSDKMLDHLEETDTLTEEIAQEIKAKNTNQQKIDTLLCNLKLRGEKAFDHFIAAIKADPVYETLATDLETEYDKLCHKPNKDSEVRKVAATQTVSSTDPVRQPVPELKLQHNLNVLYTRLKEHMTSLNMRELSFSTPKPITFQMVIDLQDQYMKSIDECYHILGVKDKTKSLRSHIVDLKAKEKLRDDQIKEKEVQRNKLSHQYIKLENKHREMNRALEKETKLNQKLAKEVHEMNLKLEELKEKGKLQEKLENVHDDYTAIIVEKKDGLPRFNRDVQNKQRNTYATLNNRKYSTQQSQAKSVSTKEHEQSQNYTDFERFIKCNPQIKFDQNFSNVNDKNDNPFQGLHIGNRTAEIPNSNSNPESSPKGSPRNVPRHKASKRKKRGILELFTK